MIRQSGLECCYLRSTRFLLTAFELVGESVFKPSELQDRWHQHSLLSSKDNRIFVFVGHMRFPAEAVLRPKYRSCKSPSGRDTFEPQTINIVPIQTKSLV